MGFLAALLPEQRHRGTSRGGLVHLSLYLEDTTTKCRKIRHGRLDERYGFVQQLSGLLFQGGRIPKASI
jgi:hypothetical protein